MGSLCTSATAVAEVAEPVVLKLPEACKRPLSEGGLIYYSTLRGEIPVGDICYDSERIYLNGGPLSLRRKWTLN